MKSDQSEALKDTLGASLYRIQLATNVVGGKKIEPSHPSYQSSCQDCWETKG